MKLILPLLLGLTFLPAGFAADAGADILTNPTAHAWKIFNEINQQVPNDPEGRVVWETWKLGREVFADPAHAPVWNPAAPAARTKATFESEPLQQLVRQLRLQGHAAGPMKPQFDGGSGNETRLNKATFDFIVNNDLYYAQGIEAFAKAGKKFDFPKASMEIKAQWRPIKPADASHYHTAKVIENGQEKVWGLTALHITTKELPNWFWATFEHKDNPAREGVLKDVQPQDQPPEFHGTKWENYVIRGTQTEFTDSIGRPTRLANSQIEAGFQQTSSCISCHALATVNWKEPDPEGIKSLPFFDDSGNGSLGTPKPGLFLAPGSSDQMRFQQMDFVWSFFRAQRRP